MSWRPVVFTVTRVRGQTPSCATWAVVSAELDDTHEVVTAKCNAWPVPADELADRRFRASSKIVTGKYGEEQLQLYGVVAVDDAPSQQPAQSLQSAPSAAPSAPEARHSATARPDLSSFAYDASRAPASKRPARRPSRPPWSARGGGRGRLDVLSDDLLGMVLDHVADDRRLGRLARVDARMQRLVEEAVQRVLSLSPDQHAVYKAVLQQKRSILLMGSAGAGKSHLLRILRARMRNVVTTASTGAAAEKLGSGATTVHSAMGMGLGDADLEKLVGMHKSGKIKASKTVRGMSSLIVDEVSMLTASLIDLLQRLLLALGKGETQFVLCGDPLQLGPVKGNTQGPFFQATMITDGTVRPFVLTTCHRQAGDEQFVRILNRARLGMARQADVDWLQAHSAQEEDEARPRLFCINKYAATYNDRKLAELPGEQFTYTASNCGDESLLRGLSAPLAVTLKQGARVMLVRNMPELGAGLHNGATGTVTDLDDEEVEVRFDNGVTATIVPVDFHVTDAKTDEVLATRTVLPLVVAYAVSVHKSQGATLDSVHVDVGRSFAPGQTFVALSRVREVAHMFIEGLSLSKLNHVDRTAVAFFKRCI